MALRHWTRHRDTSGPVVTLQAALTARGGIVALCVHVHDASRVQVLEVPIPTDPGGANYNQLHSASEIWLAILDGNVRELRHPRKIP